MKLILLFSLLSIFLSSFSSSVDLEELWEDVKNEVMALVDGEQLSTTLKNHEERSKDTTTTPTTNEATTEEAVEEREEKKLYGVKTRPEVTRSTTSSLEEEAVGEIMEETGVLADEALIKTLKEDLEEIAKKKEEEDENRPSLNYDKSTKNNFDVKNDRDNQHEIHMVIDTKETLDLVKHGEVNSTTTEIYSTLPSKTTAIHRTTESSSVKIKSTGRLWFCLLVVCVLGSRSWFFD